MQLSRSDVNPHGATFQAEEPISTGTITRASIIAQDGPPNHGRQVVLILDTRTGRDETQMVFIMTPSDAATIADRLTKAADRALQPDQEPAR